jgi:apolipoprotein N-acyltransferase
LTNAPRAAAVALASGLALSFAFPEPDIAPLAWVAIAPLLIALRDRTAWQGFWIGFAFGFGFFGSLIIWISIVGWISWLVLVILQSAFIGVFGAIVAWAGPRFRSSWTTIAIPAFAWVAMEFVRSIFPIVGFTWGQLAQSQHDLLWMLRTAGLAGSWGLALLLVAVNACIARAARGRGVAYLGGAAALILMPLVLPANEATGDGLRVAIVQGNIPEEMEPSFEKDLIIIDNHVDATRALEGEDLDLVVWPESSVGIDVERSPEVGDVVAGAARAADAEMIVGATLDTDDGKYKVTALQYSREGDIVDRYQKTHLVPFGEYVPGRGIIGWLPILDQVPRDAIPGPGGANVEPFEVAGGRVSPTVSFEGDFGSIARSRVAGGGRLLVVATNTSTWGRSWASAQHLAFSQVRAAETGSWVVHGALTGISGFVAPDGRVVQRSELWTSDTLIQDVAFTESTTLYVKLGDWLAWLSVLVVLVALLAGRRSKERT